MTYQGPYHFVLLLESPFSHGYIPHKDQRPWPLHGKSVGHIPDWGVRAVGRIYPTTLTNPTYQPPAPHPSMQTPIRLATPHLSHGVATIDAGQTVTMHAKSGKTGGWMGKAGQGWARLGKAGQGWARLGKAGVDRVPRKPWEMGKRRGGRQRGDGKTKKATGHLFWSHTEGKKLQKPAENNAFVLAALLACSQSNSISICCLVRSLLTWNL